MIGRLLRRFADAALQRQAADLAQRLDATERRLAVAEAERDTLAAVVVRERARVEAETAIHARRKAEAEGMQDDEQRNHSRLGRFTA